ncbi:MAG: 2-C-methyl-D-erythritol 2,4-cyclodiphosphate synthase [Actinomycetota bacterium]
MSISAVRVGQGFDIHRFSDDPSRVLILGGVHFVGERGLEGHSDADVIAHACADALLGAAGLGDIGQHFADTDPVWKGVDSLIILDQVSVMVAAWCASNQSWPRDAMRCRTSCQKLLAQRCQSRGDAPKVLAHSADKKELLVGQSRYFFKSITGVKSDGNS